MSHQKQHVLNILQLNAAVLLISTSGVLGRYITLPPVVTIFYRTLIAVMVFYIYCKWKNIDLKIHGKRDISRIIFAGILMGGHWITYFYSLQFSNVAIALLSLFTYPVITALLEPLLLKTKIEKEHYFLAIMVLGGVYFLSPEMDFQNNSFLAVIFGVASAFLYALRNILMKPAIGRYNGTTLMFFQILVIAIFLSPVLYFSQMDQVLPQWKPLLVLAVLTTCIGHTLFLKSFKNFSVTAASIMSSIQPVYGIILGFIFLNEVPVFQTIIGGGLIISTVIIASLLSIRRAA